MADFSMFWAPAVCDAAKRVSVAPALGAIPWGQSFFSEHTGGMKAGDRLFPVTLTTGYLYVLAAVRAVAQTPIAKWTKARPTERVDHWQPRARYVLETEPIAPLRFGMRVNEEALELWGLPRRTTTATIKGIRRLEAGVGDALLEQLSKPSDRSEDELRTALEKDPWDIAAARVLADLLMERGDPKGQALAWELALAQEKDVGALETLIRQVGSWRNKNPALVDQPGGFPYRQRFRNLGYLQVTLWNCALRDGARPAFDALAERLLEGRKDGSRHSGKVRHPARAWVLPGQPVKVVGGLSEPSFVQVGGDEVFGVLRIPDWGCDGIAEGWLEQLLPLLQPGVGSIQRRRFDSVGRSSELPSRVP